MNRIFYKIYCCLIFICPLDEVQSQQVVNESVASDILFKLPDSLLNAPDFQPGVERLNKTAELSIENLLGVDIALIYQFEGKDYSFFYDQHLPEADYIIPQAQGKNSPRAALNLLFAGVNPSGTEEKFFFSPDKFKTYNDLSEFFQDLANSPNEPFNITNADATYLYLLRLKKKTGEIHNGEFYKECRSTMRLHSRYLILFWDTLNFPAKPGIINQCEVIDVKLLTGDLPKPLENKDTPFFAQNQSLTEVSQTNPTDSSWITTIFFEGTYPHNLKLSYEIYDISGKKTIEVSDALAGSGIPVQGTLSTDPLLNQFIKVVIIKPKGYNIYSSFDAGDNWKENEYFLKIRDKSPVRLLIQKIPSFDFFYLDVSTLKKRNIAISDIGDKIEDIITLGDSYYLFISDYKQPLDAREDQDYINILGVAGSLNPDVPSPAIDIPYIIEAMDWQLVIKENKEIRFHFYLPKITYELYKKQLIVDLLNRLASRRWDVYIYSDSDMKPIVPANNNYYYINLLKP